MNADQPEFEVEVSPDDKQNVHSFACQGTLAAFTLFGRWLIIVGRLKASQSSSPVRVNSRNSRSTLPSVVSK